MEPVINETESPGARNSDKEVVVVSVNRDLIGTQIIRRLAQFRVIGLDTF